MKPSRDTRAGAVYNDLRNLAKQQGRLPQEFFELHALDGFLARLSASPERERLVVKGGALLAAFDVRRPTRDVDLHAKDLANDCDTVLALVRRIAEQPGEDGLTYDGVGATAQVIRDDDMYAGVRVSMTAHLATAHLPLHIDVNVGDPVSPDPQEVELPRLLGAPVLVLGYPMVMVFAEKIVTAISRGTANTRWRDFGDIYALSARHGVDGDELISSIKVVSTHRRIDIVPLPIVLDGYADIAQFRYFTWRRKHRRDELPEQFGELLTRIYALSTAAIDGSAAGRRWDPVLLSWSPAARRTS